MIDEQAFREMIARVRAGDNEAAEELVRNYESLVRREVRIRLEDDRLRRVLDSTDLCQSVMASFFVRAALGEYDLDTSSNLIRLLIVTARNKVASAARRQYSQKRDQRRTLAAGESLHMVPTETETPSQVVCNQELLEKARSLLTGEEAKIAEMRLQNKSWQDIASLIGGTDQARRVQYSRAVDRIRRQLGIHDED